MNKNGNLPSRVYNAKVGQATVINRALTNAAVFLPVAGAALGFAGNTYYQRLFAGFGLKPAVVELSPLDIASRGFEAMIFAPFGFVREHGVAIVWPWIPALLVGGLIGLVLKRFFPSTSFRQSLTRIVDRFDRLQARSLRWLVAIFVVGISFGAGFNAAIYDIAGIQQARTKPVNCYRIDRNVVPAVLLAQDKTTVVLVKAQSTLVRSFTTLEIAACSKPDARPAKRPISPQ